jgi:hypothetical protein
VIGIGDYETMMGGGMWRKILPPRVSSHCLLICSLNSFCVTICVALKKYESIFGGLVSGYYKCKKADGAVVYF